jgi:hypothetical protein
MEDKSPKHHIHYTLENIKHECEAHPDAPTTNRMTHMTAFLNKNLTDFSIESSKATEKYAQRAMWAAIVAATIAAAQLIVALCTKR